MNFGNIRKTLQHQTEHLVAHAHAAQQEVVVKVIGSKRLVPGKILGEGAFSVVQLFKEEDTGRQIAGKKLMASGDTLSNIKQEIAIMKQLPAHPNIVQCIGHEITTLGQGRYEVWVLMEAVSGGSVVDRMKQLQASHSKFSNKDILNIFHDACTAIAVLHSQCPPITHRDLKVENILIGSDGTHKLCDFGSATQRAYHCKTQREVSLASEDIERNTTLAYRAPEAVDPWQRQRIDEKQDVWALGVLLYYLCFFKQPFEETNLSILGGRYTIPTTKGADATMDALTDLIQKMLTQDPAKRPDVFTILDAVTGLMGTTSTVQRPEPYVAQPVGDQPMPMKPSTGSPPTSSPQASPRTEARTEPKTTVTPPATGLFTALEWAPSETAPTQASTLAQQVPAAPIAAPTATDNFFESTPVSASPVSQNNDNFFDPPPATQPQPVPVAVQPQQPNFFDPPSTNHNPSPVTDDFFSCTSSPVPQNTLGTQSPVMMAPGFGKPFDPFTAPPPPHSPQSLASTQRPQPVVPVTQKPKDPFDFSAPAPASANKTSSILDAFNSGGIGLGAGRPGMHQSPPPR
jgi:serine/threonine protein kinase